MSVVEDMAAELPVVPRESVVCRKAWSTVRLVRWWNPMITRFSQTRYCS
jgi:hypothetical protein